MRGWFAAAFMLAAVAARAETTPRNVNDCTLLTDPTALRACVDSFKMPGAEERRSDADLDSQAGRRRSGSRRGAGGASSETPRGSGPPR